MPLNPSTAGDPLGRFRHLAMVSGTQRPIPLAATRFAVRILGNLALVTAERCFRNGEARSVEATMTFPVPVQAVLVGMSARIGERRIVATTQHKTAARKAYEAAIDRGQTAVLHEEALRGVHMISVGLHGLGCIAADLRPSDQLETWDFNNQPRHLGSGVGAAAVGSLVSLLRPPTDETKLVKAVAAVLEERESADVLLVTDGKSHALDVHALARRGARFAVVLVGEDSLAANVGHLAALTSGRVFSSSGLDLAEVLRMGVGV